MAKYKTFIYGDQTKYGQNIGIFPIQGLTRVPWIFIDPVNDDEYEFAINPSNSSVPGIEKTVTTEYTTSGKPVNWEGRPAPQKISYSGTILTEMHFEIMKYWSSKKTQVKLVDDLGRSFWLIVTGFSPTRQYHIDYPWRHEYTGDATIISWE